MLNKLRAFCREQDLILPGDKITVAFSGGSDSMALLWALYLLKEEWQLDLSAVHYNHHLRDPESNEHEEFVKDFCAGYGIPLYVSASRVVAGEKGLEAAARDARYAYFRTLPGKIATAHTADDNAETVLLHLVRGTGLKGLGGIPPKNGSFIRPLLNVTRDEITAFLAEYALPHVEDGSNPLDTYQRNRIRHHVIPVLKGENPRFAENVSAMALRLRQDERALADLALAEPNPSVSTLREMAPAVRARALERFLKENGILEPEAVHIRQAEALVFSDNPSARGNFPGNITIRRNYDILEKAEPSPGPECAFTCAAAQNIENTPYVFTVRPQGQIRIRSRESGDAIRLPGGTKTLKKLFIDRKIPAHLRQSIPILVDDLGILGIPGIGVNLDRAADSLPGVRIEITG